MKNVSLDSVVYPYCHLWFSLYKAEMGKSDLCLKCFCGSSDKVNPGIISIVSRANTLKTPQLVITNVLFK